MTALDDRCRPMATRLLSTYGQTVTYTRVTAGVYNPATGSATATETASTPHAYFDTPNRRAFAEGTVIVGDKAAYISAEELGFQPAPGDRVTAGGQTLTVVDMQITSSGEQDALYAVLLRGN